VLGWVAGSARERVLARRPVVFDIFTDSSCSCGERNAKRCVCTWLLPGEGRCCDRKTDDDVKDARLNSKSRRPLQSQKKHQSQSRNFNG
jgi:hypothetical protein